MKPIAAILLLASTSIAATVTCYNDHRHRMADGHRVHLGAVAGPRWVKLGTRVLIGGRRYTVCDRTARRLNGRWDIWMPLSRRACMKIGKRNLSVRVIKRPTRR
jgi:3D (Asp-Asp-Asp) domain-containing protein